jgi:hypothetical protein
LYLNLVFSDTVEMIFFWVTKIDIKFSNSIVLKLYFWYASRCIDRKKLSEKHQTYHNGHSNDNEV